MIFFDIKNGQLADSILRYIYKNKDSLIPPRNLNCFVNRIKNSEPDIMINYGEYIFEFEDNIIEIIYKNEDTPKATDVLIDYYKRLTIAGNDETVLKKFLKKIDADNNENEFSTENTTIYVTNEYGEWYSYNKIPSRTLESIYLEDEIKNKIIKDLENFKKSEKEYNKFGIPYKRTYLLTGAPGMGKTSLVKAICNKYEYSLSMLSISKNFDNASLMNAMRDMNKNTILLLEDIDCLFEKRTVSNENPMLSFSNLINVLDGVLYTHGIIIFMTTNHPEKLDNALMRIGRVDMIIQIDYPRKEMIKKVFVDMLKNKDGEEDTDSEFENSFYNYIKNKKIPMCAIVNFLFTYNKNWEENINELLNTNNFIKKTLREESGESMYC